MNFNNWKEVYVGTYLDEYIKHKSILDEHNILYKSKVDKGNRDLPPFRSPMRNLLGRVGENTKASAMYYLYVKEEEYDSAKSLL